MARPKVPHCKECPHVSEFRPSLNYFIQSDRANWHCMWMQRSISGQEIRTSPAWCPRRRNAKT